MFIEQQEETPRIIIRRCGGYLAVSSMQPKIGVIADTEDEALAKFYSTLGRWREILNALNEPS